MLDPNQLINKLNQLPVDIRNQEKKVIEAREKLDMKKAELEVAHAQALLEADRPNATEKKQYAIVMTETLKQEVIKSQVAYDKQQSILKALENQFTSLRKISNIEMELTKSQISGY